MSIASSPIASVPIASLGTVATTAALDPGVVQLVGPDMATTVTVPLDPGVVELVGPDLTTVGVLSVPLDPGVVQLVGPDMATTFAESLGPGVVELVGPDMGFQIGTVVSLDPGVVELVGPDLTTVAVLHVPLDTGVVEISGPVMNMAIVDTLGVKALRLVGPAMATSVYVSGPRLTIKKTSDDSFVESFEIGVEGVFDGKTFSISPSPLDAGTGYYILVESDGIKGSDSGYSWPGISSKTVWNFTT